jgi:hypothetical protein
MFGVHQQIVFSKEASKQEPVPVFVSHCLFEAGNGLRSPLLIEFVTQLTAVCAKLIPQLPLLGSKGAMGLVAINGQALQRLLCAGFGDATSAILTGDSFFEQTTKFSG